MKATAMILSLLAVGTLVAAEVSGNNTAVVVQKDPVVSGNNYQFICVPVDGLDITGATDATVALSAFLPPDSYTVNTVVYPTDSTGTISTNLAYTVKTDADSVKCWKDALGSNADATTFKGGQVLWINVAVDENATTPDAVFCGQDRTVTSVQRTSFTENKMTEMKNDSSEAVAISTLIPGTFEALDEVLRLEDGSDNYQHIVYNGEKWECAGESWTSDALTIDAGEAFYFIAR